MAVSLSTDNAIFFDITDGFGVTVVFYPGLSNQTTTSGILQSNGAQYQADNFVIAEGDPFIILPTSDIPNLDNGIKVPLIVDGKKAYSRYTNDDENGISMLFILWSKS